MAVVPDERGKTALGARILRAAPTRLFLGLAALILAGVLSGMALKGLWALAPGISKPVRNAVWPLVAVTVNVATYVAFVRFVERRRVLELAGPNAIRELGFGLLLGAGLFAVTIGVITLLGGYTVAGADSPLALAPPLAMAIVSGVTEEILVRGVMFRILEEWLGTWVALALSALLFGFGHIMNPHATWWSAAAIGVEAGILLAAAYMLTRRLWLAIGLHAAWNWTQGAVFGVPVSGMETHGWLRGSLRGPAWISGGEFGAEASVVAVLVCGLGGAALLAKAIRAHGAMAPSWVRARQARTLAG